MPAVARLGDIDTGHDDCPSRPNVQGSPNVFCNGRPVHRVTDAWGPHGCIDHPSHGSVLAKGSNTVFVNNLAIGRIGDPIACNKADTVASGSPNVFAG